MRGSSTVAETYPTIPPLEGFALYAKGDLRVNDGVKVIGSGSSRAAIASDGLTEGSRLGVESVTGDGWINNKVQVMNLAKFHTLQAKDRIDPGVGLEGQLYYMREAPLPGWSFDCNDVSGGVGEAMMVEPDHTDSLPASPDLIPAVNVKAHGVLNLGCGKHYFGSLTTEPGSHVKVDTSCGPVRICTLDRGWIDFKGYLEDEDTTVEGDILLGYMGTSTVWLGPDFSGTVVAPDAKIGLGNMAKFRGALFGHDIEVMERSTVTHRPFKYPWW